MPSPELARRDRWTEEEEAYLEEPVEAHAPLFPARSTKTLSRTFFDP